MIKKYIGTGLFAPIVGVLLLASPAFAQGTADANAQISALLAQIQALQAQMASLQQGSSTTTNSASCPNLYRTLSHGSRGNDVASLQQFLRSTGDFTHQEITDYYGTATQAAVQGWQSRNGVVTHGTPDATGYGVIGPKTRSIILASCTGTYSPQSPAPGTISGIISFSATPVQITSGQQVRFSWTTSADVAN